MTEPTKSKTKGIKTGLFLILIAFSFLSGAYFDDEWPLIWACVTAEGV